MEGNRQGFSHEGKNAQLHNVCRMIIQVNIILMTVHVFWPV